VSLSSSTVVTLSGSGSFDIWSNSPTIAGLQDGVTITSGSVFNSSNIRTLTLNVSGSNSYLYSGIIGTGTGTIGIIKSGTGTQTLAGNNTYTNTTTVNAGTLKAGSTTAFSSASAFTLANTAGAVLDLNGFNNTIGSLAGGGTTGGNVTLGSATLTTGGNNGTTTYSGVISGTGGLTKAGTGNLTLSGVNTFTGVTSVSAGTLSFASGNASATANQALGANATVNLGVASTSSGILQYTGAAGTLAKAINVLGNGTDTIQNSGTGLLTLSGTITKNGTTLTLKGGSNGINVTGAIAGSNANSDLIVDGGNTTLSTANTYNGPTSIINGATLNANVTNALPTSNGRTAVYLDQTVAGAATGTGSSILALGSNQSVSSLSGQATSTVNLNARTLTIGSASGTANFAGIISGANGALIKDSASTQTLSGNNTYTGTTTVSLGTLLINGNQSSATGSVSVSNNATLGGSGTTGGAVLVASGGFLAPGALSTGTFTTTGSLSLASTATYQFQFDSGSLAADKIVANGVTLTSGSLFSYADLGSGTIPPNHVFVAIDNTSAFAISGTFSGLAEGATFTVGSNQFQASYVGGSGNDFTLTAVPEPATWALLAFSLTTVMVLR
ncbi:MAG: autotransporter-associated beta strand repeat-containing protein, partial [Verrucomicrobiota bacterium]